MKTYRILPALCAAILSFTSHAQDFDWRSLQEEGVDFYTIQERASEVFEGKTSVKGRPNYSRELKQYKRWETYWKHHITSEGFYPSIASLQETFSSLQATRGNRNGSWTYLGPTELPIAEADGYPGMGRANCLVVGNVDETFQGLFVGTSGGGLWKRHGTQWIPLTDDEAFLGVSAIMVDENSTSSPYMVIATGDAPGSHNPSFGVYISDDFGITWSPSGLSFEDNELVYIYDLEKYGSIASGTLLAATTVGLYASVDVGQNWDKILDGKIYDVHVTENGELFVTGEDAGEAMVLYSDDGGTTWLNTAPSSLDPGDGRCIMGVDPFDDYHMILVASTGYAWNTYDGGVTWNELSNFPAYESQGGYNMAAAINSQDDATYVVGGVHGWVSYDYGDSWTKYLDGYWQQGDPNQYLHSDHHDFYQDGPGFYSCNDGGVHAVDLFGGANVVTDLSDGLHITQYYGIGGLESDADYLIGGAQDNDAARTDGTNWYNLNNSSDGTDGMINFEDPSIAYAASQEGYMMATMDNWASTIDVSVMNYSCDFTWPIAMNPQNAYSIYAGCEELLKSTNGGLNWSPITNGQFSEMIIEMAVAPSDSNVIYASGGVNAPYLQLQAEFGVTTDDGATWEMKSLPPSTTVVSGITVHPQNPAIVWVTMSGYNGGDKVFQSTDHGDSWTNITTSVLPNVPVHCITVDASSLDLYIGTDAGVFVRTNGSGTWLNFSEGLPIVAVHDLVINYGAGKVRAGTFGRGIWESPTQTPTGVLEGIESAIAARLYPNPNAGSVSLDIAGEGNYDVVLFNIVGGQVFHQENVQHGLTNLSLDGLANGMYFVKVSDGSLSQTFKIEIAR